jgi:hypothetical protein
MQEVEENGQYRDRKIREMPDRSTEHLTVTFSGPFPEKTLGFLGDMAYPFVDNGSALCHHFGTVHR